MYQFSTTVVVSHGPFRLLPALVEQASEGETRIAREASVLETRPMQRRSVSKETV